MPVPSEDHAEVIDLSTEVVVWTSIAVIVLVGGTLVGLGALAFWGLI